MTEPPRRAARIGIFGGTFDPIHVGHLVAAVNARQILRLDRVLLVVANEPWQKIGDRTMTPAADRLALVEAAVASVDGLEASAIELERGGTSYTADTLAELRVREPEAELFLIVGADVVETLASWKRLDEVRDNVTLVAVNQTGSRAAMPGPEGPLAGWDAVSIEVPALEISSSDLRDRAATDRPLDYLVPEAAIRLIHERGLYDMQR